MEQLIGRNIKEFAHSYVTTYEEFIYQYKTYPIVDEYVIVVNGTSWYVLADYDTGEIIDTYEDIEDFLSE